MPDNFRVKAYLPQNRNENLAERVFADGGFARPVRAPVPPQTERDVCADDIADYLVETNVITAEQRADLIFEFEDID